MKLNVKPAINAVRKFVSGHSSDILTAVGITGMVSATILAVKATPKAVKKIEAAKAENDIPEEQKAPAKLAVKAAWREYIPAAATTIASAGCLICARKIDKRGKAALATLCTMSESALQDYKDTAKEIVGEEAAKKIEETAEMKNAVKEPDKCAIYTGHGDTLFYDAVLGRYFYSSEDAIRSAVNEVNRVMTYECTASLNDLYSEMDLPTVDIGDELGWSIDDGLINVRTYSLMPDDREPYAMAFLKPPKFKYTFR